MDRNVHLHAVMTCFLLFSRGIGIGLDDMEVIIYNDMKGNKKGSSGHWNIHEDSQENSQS